MSNALIIRSALNPDLVLTVDGDTVVLGWLNPTDTAQQWIREDHDQNFTLVNVLTGTGMTAASDDNGAAINVSGTGDQWNPGGDGAYQAIRLSTDTDMNISALGGSMNLGTPAVLWGWGGDNTDKLWDLQNANDITPPTSTTAGISAGGMALCLMVNDSGTITVEQGGYPIVNPNFLWTLTCWDTGVSFQNVGTGLFATFAGDDSALGTSPVMCIQALWTLAPFDSPGTWWAVRPIQDSGMNLNVFGGLAPDATVGVWGWNGGDNNEVWEFVANANTSGFEVWTGC